MRTEHRPKCQACVQRLIEVSQMRDPRPEFGNLCHGELSSTCNSDYGGTKPSVCTGNPCHFSFSSPPASQAGSRNAEADVIASRVQPPSSRRRLAPPSRALRGQGIPAPARRPQWKPVTPAPAAAAADLPGLRPGRLGGGGPGTRRPTPTRARRGRGQPKGLTLHECEVPGAPTGANTVSVRGLGMPGVCKRA